MAQPTPYERQFAFSGQPKATWAEGLENELNAVKVTTDETLDNLELIQRDDGKLRNGIVTRDSLAPDLALAGIAVLDFADEATAVAATADNVAIAPLGVKQQIDGRLANETTPDTDGEKLTTPEDVARRVQANVFPTRAELLARNLPTVQTRVRTSGYDSPGEGGAEYVLVDSEPAHAGKFPTPDGRWWEIAEPIISPEMLGAFGDGATDESARVQDWLDMGRTLRATPGKTYRCASTVSMPAGATIYAYGADFILEGAEFGLDSPNGAFSNTVTLTADAVKGSKTLTMAAGAEAAYAPGDALQVYSTTRRYDSVHPLKGEVHFVKSVSSGSIVLTEALWDTYLAADTSNIRKVTYNAGTKIYGGTWRGLGDAGTQTRVLRFRYQIDCGIYDANIEDGWTAGLSFYNCLYYTARGNHVRRIHSDTQGYGIFNELSSQWGTIDGNVCSDVGVSIDIGGTTAEAGAVRFLTITNNKAYDILRGCLSLHSNGCDIVIDNNLMECSDANLVTQAGLYIRAANVTATNNTIYFADGPGLLYAGIMVDNRNAVSDIILANNRIIGCKQAGISVVQSIDSGVQTTARVRTLIIDGNIIAESAKDGIIVQTSSNASSDGIDDVTITGNKFRNTTTTGNNGILINPLGALLRRVTITDNNIANAESSAGYGVRFTLPVGVTIDSILVANCNIESDVGVAFNSGATVTRGKIIGNVVNATTPYSNTPGTVTVT